MNRIEQYNLLSPHLSSLSNAQLQQIVEKGKPMHKGIGGKSVLISIDGTPIFVKKIPLTDLEQLPQHFMSTANLFDLPLYYQYGVGSAGFGAWRELATHIMTTNWVITGECPNFPLLYHSCIMEDDPSDMHLSEWGNLENYVEYWENNAAIRNRVDSLNKATMHITLFLEYIPYNLYNWLPDQIAHEGETAENAISLVNNQLQQTTQFMNARGLMHFDAHFKNILTDGKLLYLSDFGLALSQNFELSLAEIEFFKRHHYYDQAYASLNMLLSIFGAIFKKDPWDIQFRQCILDKPKELSPIISTLIEQHLPVALIMGDFLTTLRKKSKSTPFPATELEKLLRTS